MGEKGPGTPLVRSFSVHSNSEGLICLQYVPASHGRGPPISHSSYMHNSFPKVGVTVGIALGIALGAALGTAVGTAVGKGEGAKSSSPTPPPKPHVGRAVGNSVGVVGDTDGAEVPS